MQVNETPTVQNRQSLIEEARKAQEFLGARQNPEFLQEATDDVLQIIIGTAERVKRMRERTKALEEALKLELGSSNSGINRGLAVEYLKRFWVSEDHNKLEALGEEELRLCVKASLSGLR